jgi:D-glycerate 3-kinase
LEPDTDPLIGLPAFDPALLELLSKPLLRDLSARLQGGGRAPVLALNGPVGAGKSSLARLLESQAAGAGIRLAVASIDDLYLPWPQRRQKLAGNPFGVWRVPPGSHDLPLLLDALAHWRRDGVLRLPRFDKTLAHGQGNRAGWREQRADALLLEGWLMGCRPLGDRQAEALRRAALDPPATATEVAWLPRWDRELRAYEALWAACDGLWLLRPAHWGLPRRWRFQAEARQRRAGGGWLAAKELDSLVAASLRSLPPPLYQDPLLGISAIPSAQLPGEKAPALELLGGVVLDGRRRARALPGAQDSLSSLSAAIG